MKLIPLRRQDGSLRAHAIIDDDDFDRVNKYRWCLEGRYAMRKTPHGNVYLHRYICGLTPGDGLLVDHKDHNKLDCRRSNMRVGGKKMNGMNRLPEGNPVYAGEPTSSSYRGVTWDKARGKWQASVRVDGKRVFLGRFDDEHEAGRIAADSYANVFVSTGG